MVIRQKNNIKVTKKKQKTLVLLDSHAIIHRAFHALPSLTNPEGKPMGAVYGFATILLKILSELKPDYIAAAFDMAGPTFRHTAYERYKAQRPKAPDELVDQFKNVRRLCEAFGIPVFENAGYEADDVIGTIATSIAKKEKDLRVVIVTGDLDTLQLVSPKIFVYTMRKGVADTVLYDEKAVRARYGLPPSALADFKGLRGDPSDNIPGVKGIGEKTASELLKKYGSIEKLYQSLKKAKLADSLRQKLETQKEEAGFSKALATINLEVPLEFSLSKAVWEGPHGKHAVEKLFREFGFNSLLRRLGYLEKEEMAEKQKEAQGGLFHGSAGAEKALEELSLNVDLSGEDSLAFLEKDDGVLLVASHRQYQVPESVFARGIFKKILEAKRVRIFFDGKSILRKAESYIGQPQDFDLMIACYLLRPGERAYTLERVFREAGMLQDLAKIFSVAEALKKRLEERNLWKVFAEIEMPIVPILAEIEARGMLINLVFLKKLSAEAESTLNALEKEIYKLAGSEFNINSPKQVSGILFDTLRLGDKGLRKTEGGAVSTDASELAKLKDSHPIIGRILDYRETAKLKGTYIDPLPELVGEDGALHTTFNQTLTSTGRLSSSNPNLQNIPMRTEVGREIRKAFIARPGYQLVAFDYSQIELRVAAAMSGDEKMKQTFLEGGDIHTMTAMEVNNLKTLDEVTPAMRYAAKALNFGILYGMGARAFAESAGIPYADAKKFMEEYFSDFPQIKQFMERTLASARKTGYVETMLGRRRYLPEINSPNFRLRAEAERMAMNAPIQGCLPYGTKILTSGGYKPIGELHELPQEKKPKHVWDGTQWRTYLTLNRGEAKLAEVKLRNGQTLKCDTRHIVLVATDKDYEWRKFEDLRLGDNVCMSLPKSLEFEKQRFSFRYKPRSSTGLPLDIKKLDSDFWYWLGYYFGDGWLNKRIQQNRNGYQRFTLSYAFGHGEKEHLAKCTEYFTGMGFHPRLRTLPPTTKNGHNRLILSCYSQGIGLLFEKLGVSPAHAKAKRLPGCIFSESLDKRRAFIKGLFDADGWYGRDFRDVVTLHLSQKELLEDVFLLLKTLGVPSKIRGPYEHPNISYRLDIPRAIFNESIFGTERNEAIRLGLPTPQFLIEELIGKYPNLPKKFFRNESDYILYRRWRDGGSSSVYFFSDFLKRYQIKLSRPIYDISEIDSKTVLDKYETTYTLSVEESHRFDSEGIISKNTATGDIVKLAMIAVNDFLRQAISDKQQGGHILMQVHDELLCEIKKSEVAKLMPKIKKVMEGVYDIGLPLVVDVKIGNNWGDMKRSASSD